MLRCRALVVLALSVAGSSAMGAEAKLGTVSINLPVPTGFCELAAAADSGDKRMLTVVGDLVAKAGNTLLGMSADCGQLTAWRARKRPLLDDYAQYQTATATKDSSAPSETIAQTCTTLREQGKKIMEGQAPGAKANIESALKKIKVGESAFLGVLAEEPTACYAGMVQKIHTEADTDKTQLIAFAIVIVKNKSIFLYRFAPNANSDTVTNTVARMKASVAALYAANN